MKFTFTLLLVLLLSCTAKKKYAVTNSVAVTTVSINYDSCKKAILTIKAQNKTHWSHLTKAEKEMIFTSAVTKTIAPSWTGTKWDFNGVTQIPQQGTIACGYFVTTVLRDAGVEINRVKMAQCASEQLIRSLVQPKYIQRYSNLPLSTFINSISQQGYGLYIVGLDNHTGFIFNSGTDIRFIHSSYIGTRAVQNDDASTNTILNSSKYKVLGKLSSDENVLAHWIN